MLRGVSSLVELLQLLTTLRETPRKQWNEESRRLLLNAIRTYSSMIEGFRIELAILQRDLVRESGDLQSYPDEQVRRVRETYGDLERGWAALRPLADEQVPLDRVETARTMRHGARATTNDLFTWLQILHGAFTSTESDSGEPLRTVNDSIDEARRIWDQVAAALSYLASDVRAGGVI
jgi:hypothetical protein